MGWPRPNPRWGPFFPPWYPSISRPLNLIGKINLPMWTQLPYPIYVKDKNLDVHIQIFKKAIITKAKKINEDIINLFGFMFKENISKQGENFVQNHHNHTFVELEHTFCKKYLVEKNDGHIYMKLQSIKQEDHEHMEFYYKRILKPMLVICILRQSIPT